MTLLRSVRVSAYPVTQTRSGNSAQRTLEKVGSSRSLVAALVAALAAVAATAAVGGAKAGGSSVLQGSVRRCLAPPHRSATPPRTHPTQGLDHPEGPPTPSASQVFPCLAAVDCSSACARDAQGAAGSRASRLLTVRLVGFDRVEARWQSALAAFPLSMSRPLMSGGSGPTSRRKRLTAFSSGGVCWRELRWGCWVHGLERLLRAGACGRSPALLSRRPCAGPRRGGRREEPRWWSAVRPDGCRRNLPRPAPQRA